MGQIERMLRHSSAKGKKRRESDSEKLDDTGQTAPTAPTEKPDPEAEQPRL